MAVNPLAIIIVAAVIVTIIVSYLYWKYRDREDVVHYITVLSALAVVLTLAILAYTAYAQGLATKSGNQLLVEQTTVSSLIDVNQMFLKYYPYLSELYTQIFPEDPYALVVPVTDPVQKQNTEVYTIQILLRSIDDLYTTLGDSNFSQKHPAITQTLRRWFSSELVRKMWDTSKQLFDPSTVSFIDKEVIPHATYKPVPRQQLN